MKKIKVAITGGIGSGKSMVAEKVQELGYPVFSCDKIYKETIYHSKEYQSVLVKSFPNCANDGKIKKELLAAYVFQDRDALKKLNDLAHPRIMQKLEEQMHLASGIVFAEVPLLFEGGYENLFDYVIVITRNLDLRIHSIVARDNVSADEAKKRIACQFDYDSMIAQLLFNNEKYYLIENNGSIEDLNNQVEYIIKCILMKQ